MNVGSIVEVPRRNFTSEYTDVENFTIKITKIIKTNIEGIVLKNAPKNWAKNSRVFFQQREIVTSEINIREVISFT